MIRPKKGRGKLGGSRVAGAYTRYADDPRSNIDPTTHGNEEGGDGWVRTPGGGYIKGNLYYPPIKTYDHMVKNEGLDGPIVLDFAPSTS